MPTETRRKKDEGEKRHSTRTRERERERKRKREESERRVKVRGIKVKRRNKRVEGPKIPLICHVVTLLLSKLSNTLQKISKTYLHLVLRMQLFEYSPNYCLRTSGHHVYKCHRIRTLLTVQCLTPFE